MLTYLYVINANASPTKLIELPSTTPKATKPPSAPHAVPSDPTDMFVDGGNPCMWPV